MRSARLLVTSSVYFLTACATAQAPELGVDSGHKADTTSVDDVGDTAAAPSSDSTIVDSAEDAAPFSDGTVFDAAHQDTSAVITDSSGDVGDTLDTSPVDSGTVADTASSSDATPSDAISLDATPDAMLDGGPSEHRCVAAAPSAPASPIGMPVLLASAPGDGPRQLDVDDDCVYWVNYSDLSLNAVSIHGGPVVKLAGSTTDNPFAVTTDATNVYWTAGAKVLQTPKRGGATITLVTNPAVNGLGLSVNSGQLYWTNCNAGVVGRTPVGGGISTILASGRACPVGIAVLDGAVVFTQQAGDVYRLAPSTGAVETLVSGWGNLAYGLAVIGREAIWASDTMGAWHSLTRTVRTVSAGAGKPSTISTDGIDVYWPNGSAGEIRKTSPSTGVSTTLATGQVYPFMVVARGDTLYWTSRAGVTKMRVK